MRLLLITPSLAANSLGRTYCLYLLCEALGWESETWSIDGDNVWPPLASDPFATTCSRASDDQDEAFRQLSDRARDADLIIAIKPLPASLGLAWRVHLATGTPLISDIDDPDLEVLLATGQPLKAIGKRLLKPATVRAARDMQAIAAGVPRIVSNPELQRLHGGTVIPHVRRVDDQDRLPAGVPGVHVAFVGSVQPHKGIGVLRRAIADLAPDGYRLTVTADPPPDARPNEHWVGRTTLEAGIALVASADVVVIPSLPSPWARGQLPVKVVDAMLAGVCVIVSDIPPLPWAVGDGGVIVKPGSAPELVAALRLLRSEGVRSTRSAALRRLALERYTVDANRETFRALCGAATAGS